jgi:Ca2+/H+ antiporter
LLIAAYGLSLLFSLKTHNELFASEDHGQTEEAKWPINLAVGTVARTAVMQGTLHPGRTSIIVYRFERSKTGATCD